MPRAGGGRVLVAALAALLLVACGASSGSASSGGSGGGGVTVPAKVLKGQDNATAIFVPISIDGHGPFLFPLSWAAITE